MKIKHRLKRLFKNVFPRNLDVVRETYELGRSTLTDVLAEQRRYLEIEMGYTDALRAAFDARTALKQARGDVK